MRRLPVYFLIDLSESMIGEPLYQVEEGIATIVKELRTDPYALETVWLSIIGFAGKPKRITPLVDLIQFYPPRLPIGGGTSLGAAIEFLIQDMNQNLVRNTPDTRGDWRPIIFLFTDGVPTDDINRAVEQWNKYYRNKAFLVAIAFGEEVDTRDLSRLTDQVLLFKNTDAAAYRQFFKWVTASIKTTSIGVNEGNRDEFQAARTDENILSRAAPDADQGSKGTVDLQHAVFIARCQQTKKPYLMKYSRGKANQQLHQEGLAVPNRLYHLQGAYLVTEQYFELCDSSSTHKFTVSSAALVGAPNCPACGNQHGFAMCPCGGIFCHGREEVPVCPWCNSKLMIKDSGVDMPEPQNIIRGRG